jgi:hypothetical protein
MPAHRRPRRKQVATGRNGRSSNGQKARGEKFRPHDCREWILGEVRREGWGLTCCGQPLRQWIYEPEYDKGHPPNFVCLKCFEERPACSECYCRPASVQTSTPKVRSASTSKVRSARSEFEWDDPWRCSECWFTWIFDLLSRKSGPLLSSEQVTASKAWSYKYRRARPYQGGRPGSKRRH